MKSNSNIKRYIIGLITLFSLIVLIVESVKSYHYQASTGEIDQNIICSYLYIMPLLSMCILAFMAIPKQQLYKLGYYATTLGLILLIS